MSTSKVLKKFGTRCILPYPSNNSHILQSIEHENIFKKGYALLYTRHEHKNNDVCNMSIPDYTSLTFLVYKVSWGRTILRTQNLPSIDRNVCSASPAQIRLKK